VLATRSAAAACLRAAAAAACMRACMHALHRRCLLRLRSRCCCLPALLAPPVLLPCRLPGAREEACPVIIQQIEFSISTFGTSNFNISSVQYYDHQMLNWFNKNVELIMSTC